ncbi:PRD domain-containing protein [Amedibacillus sp. YH-ame10]
MYRVIKVLNNNTILAAHNQQEVVVMFKGIGFGRKVDEEFEVSKQAKKYIMQKDNNDARRSSELLYQMDPIYLEIASEIIYLAKEKFEKVDEGVLLPLADHICYAIKRMEDDLMPSNPFLNDIRLLFPDEYEVAEKGKDIIEAMISKTINEDEIGYITLHVHSAISANKVSDTMEATRIIHESIDSLQQDLGITIDTKSISYVRLMNHIKFLILRLNTNEKLQMDISEFTKEKFPFAYEKAKDVCEALSKTLSKNLPDNEIGYLALHLERILSCIT